MVDVGGTPPAALQRRPDPAKLHAMVREAAGRIGRFSAGAFDAEDIVQNAWLRLHDGALDRFRGTSSDSLRAYVWRCTRTVALEMYRSKRRRHRREEGFAALLPDRDHIRETALELVSLLERFQSDHPASECPRLLVLAFFYGSPYRDLADELETTPGAVKKRVFDCKRRVRALAA